MPDDKKVMELMMSREDAVKSLDQLKKDNDVAESELNKVGNVYNVKVIDTHTHTDVEWSLSMTNSG